MKYLATLCLSLVFLCSVAHAQRRTAAPNAREVLTNESIINLARAGFKEQTIITLIRTSETSFDIATSQLVELKKRKVTERVIAEMIERTNFGNGGQRLTTLRDDEFFSKDDDAFFNGPIFRQVPTEQQARRREGEAQIFGSQSGSKSASESRGIGPNSNRQGQSEVMGSASVRIVRPTGDGGSAATGAEPKLQRAPKLDNKGVLEMIQAGFSEGTIIRKIESSQVNFDLSSKAINDLRQNRVSDRILKAMTTAMEESK